MRRASSRSRRRALCRAIALIALLAAPVVLVAAPKKPAPGGVTVPFQVAAGRILVSLTFVGPDGRDRPALAWVNLGTPLMAVSVRLARELSLGPGQSPDVRVGAWPIEVAPNRVEIGAPKIDGEDVLEHLFAPLPVEAILPASVLSGYEVTIDNAARRLTLARPAERKRTGVATPIEVNPATGLIAVETDIGGERQFLAVDPGASFTWMRGDASARWLARHPDWRKADGAVGPSNMGLTDLGFERHGTLMGIPDVAIADTVHLTDVGALGTASLICGLCDRVIGDLFWDGWAKNAPVPVVGWIGNNVLADFRLTIDYPNHVLYWQRQRQATARTIDQVGLTLVRRNGGYVVSDIVQKDGRPTVDGVERNDQIIAVDGRATHDAASDVVMRMLGGTPGTQHRLTIERNGRGLEIDATVTAF